MVSDNSISLDDALIGRGVSAYDVLNGQGNHIKNTSGNVCYRNLVSANKELYDHCHDKDKIKISRGIVAAVRSKGGRFLAYNAHNKIFFSDIGDKKATEKTSQALRDAKRKIPPVDIPTPQVNRAKELSNELYFRYTCQVLQSLHVQDQDGCHAHSFPTVTDNIGAAPKYERDSLISERDTEISSISIGVKINKDLEHHDTRMTSSELCQKLIDGNNIGGLVDDNDVEMISTEHAHGGTHASSATTLTPQLTSVAARGMSKALEEDTMTSTSYQAMLLADVRYQDVAFGNAVAIQLNESYGTNHLQVQDDSMIFAFGEDASSSNSM